MELYRKTTNIGTENIMEYKFQVQLGVWER